MASRSNTVRTEEIRAQVALALAEDIGEGDLTASLIPEQAHSEARVISREPAVICGQEWFDQVFAQLKAGWSAAVSGLAVAESCTPFGWQRASEAAGLARSRDVTDHQELNLR